MVDLGSGSALPPRYMVRIGERDFAVAAATIRRVDILAGAVTPLPLCGALIEGVVVQDGDAVTVVNGGLLVGDRVGRGRWLVEIETAGGAVAVRADHVKLHHGADIATPPLPLDRLPRLASPSRSALLIPPSPKAPPLPLVFGRIGSRCVAFPARRLDSIAAVTGLQPLPGETSLCLARLEDEVICALRPPVETGESAEWAAVVVRDGQRMAILLSAVGRLREVPAERLHAAALPDGRQTLWCDVDEAELIEVIDPLAYVWPDAVDAIEVRGRAAKARPAVSVLGIPLLRELCLHCAGTRIAVPAAAVDRVIGRLGQLGGRGGGAPVLDLAVLLGLRAEAMARHGLALALDGWSPRVAVDRIGVCDDLAEEGWRPLPAVPAAVAELFDAMAGGDDGVIYRLRAHPPRASLRRLLGGRLAAARLGWVEPDRDAAPHSLPERAMLAC